MAASKGHTITFGKSFTVKFFLGPDEKQTQDMKIRTLNVDGRIKEFTTGEPHDITDRLFAVQQAYRVNDTLPTDEKPLPKWKWQRGSWLLVDRTTGRVSQLKLPEFSPYYSQAAWFRNYIAYCGVSDSGLKLYAIVAQVGAKKPVLKNSLGEASSGELPDANCSIPIWQREPMRVTFTPKNGRQVTYTVYGHAVDALPEPEANDNNSN